MLAAALVLAAALTAAPGAETIASDRPIVLLIGLDGWRWDHVDRFRPPTLQRLAQDGVRADGLIPIFPSKTFPSHYTIVTGLYPARHGIISNTMRDPALPGRFTISARDVQQDTRWWGGEPLWVTAERQGQIAATMFWPGSDMEIAGDRPTFWKPYEHTLPHEARVDQVLAWLDRPDPHRPTFVTLYFHDVDTAGHTYGPEAEETRRAALEIDRALARLVAGVDALGLSPRVHYVIASDHGMAPLSRDRVIAIDDFIDLETVEIVDLGPVTGLTPRAGASAEAIYRAIAGRHPALAVYTRGTLPERYRLRSHPRLPDIIAIADDGWRVTTRQALARPFFPRGEHGYDPEHRSMHGIFIAYGPRFARGLRVPAFENVHLYELICRLLGLTPAPNDGDPGVSSGFLRAAPATTPSPGTAAAAPPTRGHTIGAAGIASAPLRRSIHGTTRPR